MNNFRSSQCTRTKDLIGSVVENKLVQNNSICNVRLNLMFTPMSACVSDE